MNTRIVDQMDDGICGYIVLMDLDTGHTAQVRYSVLGRKGPYSAHEAAKIARDQLKEKR